MAGWLKSQRECMEFVEYHIHKGQFQWFIEIVSCLKFLI